MPQCKGLAQRTSGSCGVNASETCETGSCSLDNHGAGNYSRTSESSCKPSEANPRQSNSFTISKSSHAALALLLFFTPWASDYPLTAVPNTARAPFKFKGKTFTQPARWLQEDFRESTSSMPGMESATNSWSGELGLS